MNLYHASPAFYAPDLIIMSLGAVITFLAPRFAQTDESSTGKMPVGQIGILPVSATEQTAGKMPTGPKARCLCY